LEDSMLSPQTPITRSFAVRAFASILSVAVFTSGCSTAPSSGSARAPANADIAPLSYEQLRQLEEVGVGILSMAMVGNHVSRGAKIDADLKARLDRIGINGEARSADGLLLGAIGIMGLTSAAKLAEIGVHSSGFSLKEVLVDRIGTGAAISLVVGYASAVAVGLGESSGSWTPLREKPAEDARAAAAVEKRRLQAAFEADLKSTVDRYSTIFSLTPAAQSAFTRRLRVAVIDEAKRAPSAYTEVRVNVPAVLVEAKLIDEKDYDAFLETLELLQKSTRTEAGLTRTLDGKLFAENVRIAKQSLTAYVDWLRTARPAAAEQDRKIIDRAVSRAERLLQRI
jgi:hypothetical protein